MKYKSQQSLSKLLTQNYQLISLLPLLLFSMALLFYVYLSISKQVENLNRYYLESLSEKMDFFLDESVYHLSIQNDIVNSAEFPVSRYKIFDFFSESDNFFEVFLLLDHQGLVQHIYPANPDLLGSDMSLQKYFYKPYEEDDVHFSEVIFSPLTGHSTLIISQRNERGVLVGFLDLKRLNDMVLELQEDFDLTVMVLDATGKVIAHKNRSLVEQQWNINADPEMGKLLKKETGTMEVISYDKALTIATRLSYAPMKWDIIILQSFLKIYQTVFVFIAVILCSLVFIFLLIFRIVRTTGNYILFPVVKLIEKIKRIEQGYYDFESFGTYYAEINFLNASFMSMSHQIQKREQSLQNLVKEKDLLMREINHRVKNNLIMLHGLISLQQDSVDSQEGIKCLEDAKNRIKSISMVHQMLYQTKNYGEINLKHFLLALLNELRSSFNVENSIVFEYDLQDVFIDLSQAVPCGLILNELITNSLKHGFPGGREGKIRAHLSEKNMEIYMSIEDNGIGMNWDVEIGQSESFGLKLVSLLRQQLNGSITVIGENGTKITINFPKMDIR
ncbi:MAG: hypothetical protein JXR70_04540 [Spirochaetales bacterium]|nr:hypothetical protein [Spirochaetales bacterium]